MPSIPFDGYEWIAEFDWDTPVSGHYCLLARIEESSTHPHGMTYPETIDTAWNAQQNNNIAWRNVNVVNMNLINTHSSFNTIWRNVKGGFSLQDIRFSIERANNADIFMRKVEIQVQLDDLLFERWIDGGGVFDNMEIMEERLFRIMDVRAATLGNIGLEEGDAGEISVFFNLIENPTVCDANYSIHMVQYENGEEQGGVKFDVRLREQPEEK